MFGISHVNSQDEQASSRLRRPSSDRNFVVTTDISSVHLADSPRPRTSGGTSCWQQLKLLVTKRANIGFPSSLKDVKSTCLSIQEFPVWESSPISTIASIRKRLRNLPASEEDFHAIQFGLGSCDLPQKLCGFGRPSIYQLAAPARGGLWL